MLNFPEFGGPVFDMFLALAGGTVLPKEVREIVILATGGRLGALYEIYSHETIASKAGMSQAKIRTLASGERPIDLTEAETIAYDITAVLTAAISFLPASIRLPCPPSGRKAWRRSLT